ncbi:hypothetical protein PAXRUDRAFT_173271, partial [Paxillus rubicundulus Ve08.2h10]
VSLNGDGTVWNPMSKDRGRGEGLLEFIEGRATGVVKSPGSVFSGESVIEYKSVVKIGKPEEGLNVLHFAGFRPIPNGLDFFRGHHQT